MRRADQPPRGPWRALRGAVAGGLRPAAGPQPPRGRPASLHCRGPQFTRRAPRVELPPQSWTLGHLGTQRRRRSPGVQGADARWADPSAPAHACCPPRWGRRGSHVVMREPLKAPEPESDRRRTAASRVTTRTVQESDRARPRKALPTGWGGGVAQQRRTCPRMLPLNNSVIRLLKEMKSSKS